MAIIEGVTGLKVASAEYDFAVDGGAISTITLRSLASDSVGSTIPNGAVILGGYVDVLTALTSGGAVTNGINSEGAGDIVTAAILGTTGFGTMGRKSITPANGATSVKTTAARSIAMSIGVAALTAGKLRVVLLYI